jgi:hypothetical protein
VTEPADPDEAVLDAPIVAAEREEAPREGSLVLLKDRVRARSISDVKLDLSAVDHSLPMLDVKATLRRVRRRDTKVLARAFRVVAGEAYVDERRSAKVDGDVPVAETLRVRQEPLRTSRLVAETPQPVERVRAEETKVVSTQVRGRERGQPLAQRPRHVQRAKLEGGDDRALELGVGVGAGSVP